MTTPIGRRRSPSTRHSAGRPRRVGFVVLGALLLVILVLPGIAGFATDWLWFREVQFEAVFLTSLRWRVALFVAGAIVAFGILYGNIWWARRGAAGFPALFVDRGGGIQFDVARALPRTLLLSALLVALVVGITASSLWMTFLTWAHGTSVGGTDPLFGRDLGFYLFTLPGLTALLNLLVTLTLLSLIVVTVLHGLRGHLVLPPRRVVANAPASWHLGTLLALLFLLFALQLWFVDASDLLYSTTGPLVGASYSDVHVLLPGIRASALIALLAAATVIIGAARGRFLLHASLAVVGYAGAGILLRGVLPLGIQKFSVAPNELARELPYLQNHIVATRRAWKLDSVETRDLDGDVRLTMADIRANAATIENVRLWERDLLKQTFGQLQEIRTYYDFASVNDDRYMIDGNYRQVHLSARELNPASLPTRNFINERLTFTHGMGITMAPVNQVTSEGLPVLFIKDLPPVSVVSLQVTRPQIYYGELTKSYVFVGTGQKEFDYPEGDKNVYTNYTGKGGVSIGSLARRALFAWHFGSADLLFSSYLGGDARILYRRTVMERASAALPFLEFDPEPYIVLTDAGRLVWMLDAYTLSRRYPYSAPVAGGVNYMRNSVKVVIDAYDGTVDAYLADPADPVARTYAAAFGAIFKPLSAMPADVRRHVRYPGALFRLQTALHATYHMVDPGAFYHREDQWQYPAVAEPERLVNTFMRHIILRLPGETEPEFIYMTPFTPRGKDNLAAWMVARMDGDQYGKLVVYRFPKQSLVYGPKQIANRINQDTEISRQITLWDQRGSKVIRGELLVIPIEGSLIYVQPVYLRAEGGTIPELKRVVVAHENQVAMAETLEQGLKLLFGGTAPAARSAADSAAGETGATGPAAATPGAADAGLLMQAQQHYDRAMAAQRAGDWARYGREIDQLGELLQRLRAR